MKPTHLIAAVVVPLAAASCSSRTTPVAATAVVRAEAPAASAPGVSRETQRLNAFFTAVFMRTVKRSPMIQAYLGFDWNNDAWDDISDARARQDAELARQDLATLRGFDPAALDDQARLSHRLFERRLLEQLDDFEWRLYDYPVNQMFGLHAEVPAFLSNFHEIDDADDARAYIARLDKLPALFAQLEDNLVLREQAGIMPPRFVFPMAIEDSNNIISGAPFDGSAKPSAILDDFEAKLAKLEGLDAALRAELRTEVRRALTASVKPAYESLIATLERQSAVATTDDGVWKLPDGAAYYARELAKTTTTSMTAEDIHQLGLREVERIHDEMRGVIDRVGFKGSLQEFFTFVRTDPQFYYPDTEAGRAAYLADAKRVIDAMEARLDRLFVTSPKARMIVKRVEPYRENSAGLAFYNPPSLDGSREGIYYVNLYDMNNLPRYELEALAFHEGIPGHHMQNAISMEREQLPMFRRLLGYTAYGEGWGLYAERLGKELGFYQDPYSDFGRLSMELWRACRLVVDTGIHHKRWTREQAMEWLAANTPAAERDVRKAVERYIVMPSQATAYTIGMLEILRLRSLAREALGEAFDLRQFHEVILSNGALPLPILEEAVEAWIASQGG
jgi:uncharacterized protein (DUF885 family)